MKREIEVDGARLAVHESGQGEPIVLLHGYPQDHRAWRRQIPALSATHRVLALDWFGWGESDRRARLDHGFEAEVARLGRVLDALDLDRTNLFVHDYGGLIGLGFLAARPDRVRRFAILDSRAHDTFPGLYYAATWAACLAARTPPAARILARLPLARIHRLGLDPFVDRGCFDRDLAARYVAFLEDRPGREWWIHFFGRYELPPRRDLLAPLSRIDVPAAVVWGTRDPWCPVRIARELARTLPNATLTELRGASHFVMEERPAEVTAALKALLARPASAP